MLKFANFVRKFWLIFAILGLYILLAGLNILPRGFNIFKKQRLLIDKTPVVVKEIRELGELTTAEFYGEVYADLNEVYEDIVENLYDSIQLNPGLYYSQYKGLRDYLGKAEKFRLRELEYKNESGRYEETLSLHLKKLDEFKTQEKDLKNEINQSQNKKEKRQLENKLDDLGRKFQAAKDRFTDAQKRFKNADEKYRAEKTDFWQSKKRRNLVYIGRGWVKAGVNLKDLSEEDIIIDDDDSSTIQILISDPQILDADINPWFIYTNERKVKGFEVFIAKTGSLFTEDNFTDREITQLKIKCKQKLKEEALYKGLLENAKTSAVQTLENFFHLVGFNTVQVRFRSNTVVATKEN